MNPISTADAGALSSTALRRCRSRVKGAGSQSSPAPRTASGQQRPVRLGHQQGLPCRAGTAATSHAGTPVLPPCLGLCWQPAFPHAIVHLNTEEVAPVSGTSKKRVAALVVVIGSSFPRLSTHITNSVAASPPSITRARSALIGSRIRVIDSGLVRRYGR